MKNVKREGRMVTWRLYSLGSQETPVLIPGRLDVLYNIDKSINLPCVSIQEGITNSSLLGSSQTLRAG